MRFIFAFLILFSCTSENSIHLSNLKLFDEIMSEHDELMLDMRTLNQMKEDLLEIDGFDEESKPVKDLDEARMSMMSFMKEFGGEFTIDSYPMDKKSHTNLEGVDLLSVNKKLLVFKDKINGVSVKFSTSISEGNNILESSK